VSTVSISRVVAAPVETTWALLADLGSHPTWMSDAAGIEFLTGQTTGLNTAMRVPTRIGPFHTNDVLVVVEWIEGVSIKVEHRGLVSGIGEFTVDGDGERSTITWREQLHFPWWLGGAVTAWLARPVLRFVWNNNLDRFAALAETAAAAG
jgi:uncharacterized protein YndB with AHSA1/START domain